MKMWLKGCRGKCSEDRRETGNAMQSAVGVSAVCDVCDMCDMCDMCRWSHPQNLVSQTCNILIIIYKW